MGNKKKVVKPVEVAPKKKRVNFRTVNLTAAVIMLIMLGGPVVYQVVNVTNVYISGLDYDGDQLTNSQEKQLGTSRYNTDSDSDTYDDYTEYNEQSLPTDAASTPATVAQAQAEAAALAAAETPAV